MGVSGQRHASAALYPRGKDPRVAGWAPFYCIVYLCNMQVMVGSLPDWLMFIFS
jgi:hypothetical protein